MAYVEISHGSGIVVVPGASRRVRTLHIIMGDTIYAGNQRECDGKTSKVNGVRCLLLSFRLKHILSEFKCTLNAS